jgi:hypothetical protein
MMKRFRRWLFNGLTTLSAFLCVATLMLMVIGFYFDAVSLWYVGSSDHVIATLYRRAIGVLVITRLQPGILAENPPLAPKPGIISIEPYLRGLPGSTKTTAFIGAPSINAEWGKFLPMPLQPSAARTYESLGCDLWFILLLSLIAPATHTAIVVRRRHLRTKMLKGLCANCGYDLRASPDQCPECGTVPPKKEVISN